MKSPISQFRRAVALTVLALAGGYGAYLVYNGFRTLLWVQQYAEVLRLSSMPGEDLASFGDYAMLMLLHLVMAFDPHYLEHLAKTGYWNVGIGTGLLMVASYWVSRIVRKPR